MTPKETIATILLEAGITLNGNGPIDVRVHDETAYSKVLTGGTLAAGELFMKGSWECQNLDEALMKLGEINVADKFGKITPDFVWMLLTSYLSNTGTKALSKRVAAKHYNLGNDLYSAMLGQPMCYTCGYWSGGAKSLSAAQTAKLELVCKKLRLKPGMRVLDIGGGWGVTAKHMAENYGVSVVNITISDEQVSLANELCKGLSVENRLQDYRDVSDGPYDRICSIGMFEHVGPKNYATYIQTARRLLKDDGLFLLHTIGGNQSTLTTDPWLEKYIFPGSVIPSIAQIGKALEKQFVMEDWHAFGPDYDKTLMAWWKNFDAAWPTLKETYGEEFYRMWKFYLMFSAAGFRNRNLQLWQILLSPNGVRGGLAPVR